MLLVKPVTPGYDRRPMVPQQFAGLRDASSMSGTFTMLGMLVAFAGLAYVIWGRDHEKKKKKA